MVAVKGVLGLIPNSRFLGDPADGPTTIKSTADFLKGAGRISAAADSYTKFVNAEFAKAAAGK